MKSSIAWAVIGLLHALPAIATDYEHCPEGQRVTLSPGYTVEYRRGRFREGDVHEPVNSQAECIQICQDTGRPVCSFHGPTRKCIVGTECGKDIDRDGVCYMFRVNEIDEKDDPFTPPRPPPGSVGEDPVKELERLECLNREATCQAESSLRQAQNTACLQRESTIQAANAACEAQKASLLNDNTLCAIEKTKAQSDNTICQSQKSSLETDITTCATEKTKAQSDHTVCEISLKQCQANVATSTSSLHSSRVPPADCARKGWGQGYYRVDSGLPLHECRRRCQSEARCVAYSDDVFGINYNCYLYDKPLASITMTEYPYWATYAKSCN